MADPIDLSAYRGGPPHPHPVPLENKTGGGDSNGMDPWQQTVETRLGELRADLRGVASDVGAMKADMATLKEGVSHLPDKGFIVKTTLAALGLISALALFGPNLRSLLHLT